MDTNQYSLIWLSIGILLLASEVFTGTFYLLLIGVSSILVSVINYIFNLSWPVQIIALGTMSSLSIFFLRGKLLKTQAAPSQSIDEAGIVTAINTIMPQSEGLVQYQGVPWTAINQSHEMIEAGKTAVVIQTQGNKLIITPTKTA